MIINNRVRPRRHRRPPEDRRPSAIASEIHKQRSSKRIDADLYHLRTVDGREVDLLIELDQGFIPIDIKQSEHVSECDSRHLRDLDSILDKPVIHSFILSRDNEIKKSPKT